MQGEIEDAVMQRETVIMELSIALCSEERFTP